MNPGTATLTKVVVLVVVFIATFGPVFFIFFAFKWAGAGMHGAYNAIKGTVNKARGTAGNLGKKAAMSSKYGQMGQQFMANRKAIQQLKGREGLREALNRNPTLARLMGGQGGAQHANRLIDEQNRKHRAEQSAELSKGMTRDMANAISKHQNLGEALRTRRWSDGKALGDEDINGIQRMQAQGYLGTDGRVRAGTHQSATVANAALEALYRDDDVNAKNVSGLGTLLQGTDAETNANFTKLNRDLAVKNKNKNVAFAQFNNGEMTQFVGKTPDAILASSGLSGINKDALKMSNTDLPFSNDNVTIPAEMDPNHPWINNAMLNALGRDVGTVSINDEGANVVDNSKRDLAKVLKYTRESLDYKNAEVIKGVSQALGFNDVKDFEVLRTAVASNGAIEIPEPYRSAAQGLPAPTAAPAPQPAPTPTPPPAPTFTPPPTVNIPIQRPPQPPQTPRTMSGSSGTNFEAEPRPGSGLYVPHDRSSK
ncbi:MAG TPA: hypothetical protein VLG40_00975 [Candidatus Saccharimonas sp.]|nr:hypothetical protein [Candidatus Saccharimonas sp.]